MISTYHVRRVRTSTPMRAHRESSKSRNPVADCSRRKSSGRGNPAKRGLDVPQTADARALGPGADQNGVAAKHRTMLGTRHGRVEGSRGPEEGGIRLRGQGRAVFPIVTAFTRKPVCSWKVGASASTRADSAGLGIPMVTDRV